MVLFDPQFGRTAAKGRFSLAEGPDHQFSRTCDMMALCIDGRSNTDVKSAQNSLTIGPFSRGQRAACRIAFVIQR
jgi:hypothetical protein